MQENDKRVLFKGEVYSFFDVKGTVHSKMKIVYSFQIHLTFIWTQNNNIK